MIFKLKSLTSIPFGGPIVSFRVVSQDPQSQALAEHESTLLKACLSTAYLDASKTNNSNTLDIDTPETFADTLQLVILDSRQLGMLSKVLLLVKGSASSSSSSKRQKT